MGIDQARHYLSELLENALSSLQSFGSEADTLRAMADYVVARTH
jgi:geranylgeranyl diphosphate synthase type II